MQTVVLDVYSIQCEIRNTLRATVGVAADVMDISDMLIAAFEDALAGRSLTVSKTLSQMLCEYGVPSARASAVVESAHTYFRAVIDQTIGLYQPDLQYDYRLMGLTDFVVQIKPYPTRSVSAIDQFQQRFEQELSNGDWYSERIRRIVGTL